MEVAPEASPATEMASTCLGMSMGKVDELHLRKSRADRASNVGQGRVGGKFAYGQISPISSAGFGAWK